ncbi:MAG: glycosyltransferase family 39 protein [Lewinellaceae bacterium]|nr:glycosyltransferase family 39 protein [Lewinellaceae bacterium]
MTSNRHPLRFLPLAVVAILIILAKILSFNGLYGQDAHEYLRLSRAYFDHLRGLPYLPAGRGDAEFAVGYPLCGALLQLTGLVAALALQIISWAAAGAAAYFFDRCLQVLTPGARAGSRWTFTVAGLLLAPYFVRAGLTSMSDAPGLAFFLAALAHGLRVLETGRIGTAVWAAFFAGLAVITRFSLAVLLAPLVIAVGLYLVENRRWVFAGATILVGLLAVFPHFWLKTDVPGSVFGHSLLQGWSGWHYFHATFSNSNGSVNYGIPNGLYLLLPLAHPGFCLLLPGLLLLFKKTDLHLVSKKVLAASLVVYLLFLGGVPHQNMRYLLPAFAVLLLIFFPAWDRMFSYGFYFFKRLTFAIIGLTFAVQVCCITLIIRPVIVRNRLETGIATGLQNALPAEATLFAFDLDVALRSYLPGLRINNLWEQLYTDFPAGSFILFNEPLLRPQWQGRNPILNWDYAKSHYRLEEIRTFPGGWQLYEIKGVVK